MSEKYTSFRKRKKSPFGVIGLALVIIGIIIIGAAVAVYLAVNSAQGAIDSSDIPLNCYVSGDDIIVILQDAGRTSEITSLEIILTGYVLPPGYGIKTVPNSPGEKKITYPDLAGGVSGSVEVVFKAEFVDGSKKTIWADTIVFS